ncbi:MFS transporter [Rothia sp. LK2588]|uniref:MFS transporter n=1 Tax=Rothia sp. LK2588 TaxID=3114369 RepID=UPI0034CF04AB
MTATNHITPAASSTHSNRSPLTPGFTFAVLLGVTLNPLNTSVIATALVGIGRDFGVNTAELALLISVLYVVSAVAQPLMGRIATRYGARTVYLVGLVLAGLGGVIGWGAPSFGFLIAARLVLGLGTAAAYPTAMMMIRQITERHRQPVPAQLLSLVAASGHVMAAVGLPVGGLLVSIFGWRSVFAMNVPLALISLVAVLAFARVPGANDRVDDGTGWRTFDPVGVLLFALCITATMITLRDFTHLNVWAAAVMVLTAGALWVWSHRAAAPLLDVRKLGSNGALLRTYLRLVFTFAVLYAMLYGVSQWLEQARGFDPSTVGFLMIPMSALSALASMAVGRGARVRSLLVASSVLMVAAAAGLVAAALWHSVWIAVAAVSAAGIAMGMNNVGNQAMLYLASPAADMGVNSGFYRTFSYVGGFVATGLLGTVFLDAATDARMGVLAAVLGGLGVALVALVALDRKIPARAN